MFKQVYKQLYKELLVTHRGIWKLRWAKEVEKRKAHLHYLRLQQIRKRESTEKIDKDLEEILNEKESTQPLNTEVVRELVQQTEPTQMGLNNLRNITLFLNSQRNYSELLERYNPGLSMTQEDNVRKAARRVGMMIPENGR